MSEMLHITEDFKLELPKLSETATNRVTEALLPAGGSNALEVTFAAIHEGLTRNNTFYSKDGLTAKTKNAQGHPSGLESWTSPVNAPILKDHEATADNILGRVIKAEWVEPQGKEKGHVQLTARITNPEAIEKFIRGEYQTGSIGMDVDTAECSICSSDFMKGWRSACEHERGKWYKKGENNEWAEATANEKGARRMHINIGNVWAREYSVVATPSDAHSKVKAMQVVEAYFTEGEERFNLLEGAQFVENENKPDELAEKVIGAKVLEALQKNLNDPHLSPTYEYLVVALTLVHGDGMIVEIEDEKVVAQQEQLEEYLSIIEDAYPELDSELNALHEAVLSSAKSENLPDSAFGLVWKNDDNKVRLFPYKNAEGVVDEASLLLALSTVGQAFIAPPIEREKAIRRLLGVARKQKIVAASKEEEITEAKAVLEAAGLVTVEAAEQTRSWLSVRPKSTNLLRPKKRQRRLSKKQFLLNISRP
jgi:hypothetical protein